ncbi:MAG: HNH endonuclease [Pirellulales bacterium]
MAISAQARKTVAERAAYCCEYCQSQLRFSADSFSVEHVVPRSRGGSDELSNLALSCQRCNNGKFVATEAVDPLTGVAATLFDPRREDWAEHFVWSHDFLIIHGMTPTGRATVDKLQLNRAGVVNLRRILRDAGKHPPRT